MAGRIVTGFSKPYVANYTFASGTGVTYSNPTILAKGVDVEISPDTTDDNNYWADNEIAETESGTFNGGTLKLTINGLDDAGNKLIYGLGEPDSNGWTEYSSALTIPEVGVGYIARVKKDGVTKYVPTVVLRARFIPADTSASTGEESINWQSQTIEATMMRSQDTNKGWKSEGAEYTTESAAEAALVAYLSSTIA